MKNITSIFVATPCLAAAFGPAAQAAWKDATLKKIHNLSGTTVTLVLKGTDQPGVVGVGPFQAGLGDPEAEVLAPRPAAGAAGPDGARTEFTLAHGEAAGLYLDDTGHRNHFRASFAILDAAGATLVEFRTQATDPDQYAWLEVAPAIRVCLPKPKAGVESKAVR